MTHLHSLKLSYNRIHFLPVELGELKMLKDIGLQYNPVLELQPQIAHFANDAQVKAAYPSS
jgi:Leucine-rich repeat (LRR) protein